MAEKDTLIGKISAHPRIWGIAALTAAVCCIILGLLGLMPAKTISAEDIAHGHTAFAKAQGSLVRYYGESFEIRNTFCRFLPTGVQYIYLAYTEEGEPIFLRAGRDWADSFDSGDTVEIYGAVRSFNAEERAYITDAFGEKAAGFADLIYVRLDLLLIAAGALLLAEAGLGALMIKKKIPSQGRGYKFANAVFCTLPAVIVGLGIHLVGFV